ncbi:MAG: PKD domain-containing protein, partial [Ferruginibacter sp.]
MSVTVYLVAITTLVFGQTVDFNINNSSQCYTGNQYIFTNNSTAGASAYFWNFGDGTTSTAANPTKSYSNAGNYSVQLMATYNNVNYYVNKTVYVNPVPVCGFNFYAATNTGNSYTFQSTSYISSGYANYTWDFGDSSTANGTNPLHTFGHNGSYTIGMTAMSDKGCTCSSTQNITVTVSVPFVMGSMNFSVNNSTQCLTGNSFYFNNNSNNISAATYSWDFGDGSTSTTFSPTHSYSNSGTYVVSLIATVSGNIFTKTQTVTVQPKTSISISTSATKICSGNTVTYTASANNYYGSPNYQWKVNNVNAGTNSNSFSSATLSDSDKVNCIMTANNTCWATET